MRELMRRFHRAIAACLFYEGACVAAVGGHALAGGALLALACDRRILALGAGKVGIHGARMGLAYPDIAVEVVRHALSRKEAERALYGAGLVEAELAHRRGWSQELVEPASLEEAARSQLSLLRQAEGAFASNKRALLARCAIRVDTMDADGEDRFLDRWFAADTRERLTAALEALGRTGARAQDGEK
jgi:enoyl-CoA hydratase